MHTTQTPSPKPFVLEGVPSDEEKLKAALKQSKFGAKNQSIDLAGQWILSQLMTTLAAYKKNDAKHRKNNEQFDNIKRYLRETSGLLHNESIDKVTQILQQAPPHRTKLVQLCQAARAYQQHTGVDLINQTVKVTPGSRWENNQTNPLYCAVLTAPNAVTTLMRHGADPNLRVDFDAPFSESVQYFHDRREAWYERPGHNGKTVLMIAVEESPHLDVLNALFDPQAVIKADPNLTFDEPHDEEDKFLPTFAWTPVQLLCHRMKHDDNHKDDKWIGFLARHGAKLNTQDWEGDAPLHDACYGNYSYYIERLLKYNADVLLKNQAAQIPLERALDREHFNGEAPHHVLNTILINGHLAQAKPVPTAVVARIAQRVRDGGRWGLSAAQWREYLSQVNYLATHCSGDELELIVGTLRATLRGKYAMDFLLGNTIGAMLADMIDTSLLINGDKVASPFEVTYLFYNYVKNKQQQHIDAGRAEAKQTQQQGEPAFPSMMPPPPDMQPKRKPAVGAGRCALMEFPNDEQRSFYGPGKM